MMAPPVHPSGIMFWTELVYSLVVIVSCLIIFLRTKEIYDLSLHKGIKYFRNAFLFFGIAFFARLFLRLIADVNGPGRMDFLLFNLGFFVFLYAGLIAGFYLVYSSIWKEIDKPEKFGMISHPIALTIAAIIIIFLFGPFTIFVLGFALFFAAILAYSQSKKNKSRGGIKQLHVIYLLLFSSWIGSAIAHLFVVISIWMSFLLYGFSSLIFILLLYKVVDSTKS